MDAFHSPFTIPIVAIIGVFSCGIVSLIAVNLRHIAVRRAEEESRREIAAYIAEGSMTVDDGERLLKAARSPTPKDE